MYIEHDLGEWVGEVVFAQISLDPPSHPAPASPVTPVMTSGSRCGQYGSQRMGKEHRSSTSAHRGMVPALAQGVAGSNPEKRTLLYLLDFLSLGRAVLDNPNVHIFCRFVLNAAKHLSPSHIQRNRVKQTWGRQGKRIPKNKQGNQGALASS